MKNLLLLLFSILFYSSTKSQEYITAGVSNNNIQASLVVNGRHNVYGFGISGFYNKGNKGQDYTNFILVRDNSYAYVYERLLEKTGSIYLLYGKNFNDILVSARVGFGVKQWFNNGKTNEILWYTYTDGGTYLLYGLNVMKKAKRFLFGLGYDNFNGANLSLGFSLKKVR